MRTLLTPDSRNLFDNPVLDFEHGSLMLKIDKQSLRKPPPSLILSFIKTDFCPSVAVEELSLNAGSWEHTIVGSSTFYTMLVSLSSRQ